MKYLHDLARTSYKDIDVPVGRIQTDLSHLSAQAIYTHTHIHRLMRHYYAIILIQIEHDVFDCKVRKQIRHEKVGVFRMVTMKFITAPLPTYSPPGLRW
jgi:hypothetical protein